MAVEQAADLAAFFDTGEWGEAATYTPAAGGPVAVTVIFAKAHEFADLAESGINAPAHRALVRASEVASPAPGDSLAIGAQTFTITQADQGELGSVWTLWLAEQ